MVPLLDGTGLGIALFSYDGRIHVGLNADYDLVPDLGTFTALFAQSFMAVADSAGIEIAARDAAREEETSAIPYVKDAGIPENEAPVTVRPSQSSYQANEVALSASGPPDCPKVLV